MMFFLSKLFQWVLFPPGILIVLLTAGIILIHQKNRKSGKIVLTAAVVLFYLLSVEPVQNVLLRPLETAYQPLNREHLGEMMISGQANPGSFRESGPAIVVLGGGTVYPSPEEENLTSLAPGSSKRTIYAAQLREITGGDIICSGGSVYPRGRQSAEADSAAAVLIDLGVPAEKIIRERKSRNTWENALYTRELLEKPSDAVILVTSSFHMRRSMACFRKQGMYCIPAPTDYRRNGPPYTFSSFLPSMDSLQASTMALREYWGNLYYRIRYFR